MTARLWAFTAAATVAVLLAAGGVVLLGSERSEEAVGDADAPGYDGSASKIANDPFRLAQPTTTAGPTTMPVDPEQRRESARNGERTAPSTIVTTTTAPPTAVAVPPSESIDSICGIVAAIESLQVVFADPSLDGSVIMPRALSTFDRYVEVSPEDLRVDVAGLRDDMARLTDILRGAGWDAQSGAALQAVAAIRTETAPFQFLQARARKVTLYESTACGE